MTGHFEVRQYDAAGRLGELSVPRAGVTVETPALLPVVNPHVQTVQPATMEAEFGAEMLITNSYVLHRSDELRGPVEAQGLHELLDFSGAIMTDSGSFQLAEYGDIDVTTEEILEFQYAIGSDVGTPVDVPTPPDVDRQQAEEELVTTQERLEVAADVDVGDMLVTAPIQGSTHPDLRTAAAEHADALADGGLDVFPVGAVVPLLNDYRYADVVDVVAAAKRGLGESAPVHLFGAGHPMMFALAVALGCDLFDSAAYALYARDDRYLTVRGTEHLADLEHFPCTCPICVEYTPADLRAMDGSEDAADGPATREELLARHNLYVTFGEMRTIRQAIRDGDLLELVDARARGHPAMVDGLRALYDHAEQLAETDPVSKDTVFHVSAESASRPEVLRHQRRLDRFDLAGEVLLTEGDANDRYDESWRVKPPFGPYPPALAETYPLTAETPAHLESAAYRAAAAGVARLVAANPAATFTLCHRDWPAAALAAVPDDVALSSLHPE